MNSSRGIMLLQEVYYKVSLYKKGLKTYSYTTQDFDKAEAFYNELLLVLNKDETADITRYVIR